MANGGGSALRSPLVAVKYRRYDPLSTSLYSNCSESGRFAAGLPVTFSAAGSTSIRPSFTSRFVLAISVTFVPRNAIRRFPFTPVSGFIRK